jgi:hypothetical protein
MFGLERMSREAKIATTSLTALAALVAVAQFTHNFGAKSPSSPEALVSPQPQGCLEAQTENIIFNLLDGTPFESNVLRTKAKNKWVYVEDTSDKLTGIADPVVVLCNDKIRAYVGIFNYSSLEIIPQKRARLTYPENPHVPVSLKTKPVVLHGKIFHLTKNDLRYAFVDDSGHVFGELP